MVSCFAVLTCFAIFAGFKEVKSIHIEKIDPGISIFESDSTKERIAIEESVSDNGDENCSVQVVETVPLILNYPPGSVKYNSTVHSWEQLLLPATSSEHPNVKIASAYWTMLSRDVTPVNKTKLEAIHGETIFKLLQTIAKKGSSSDQGESLTIVNSYPFGTEEGNDTDVLASEGAEVRLLDMPALVGNGILHTKLIINPETSSLYVGSANMDWRSLSLVKEMGLHFNSCSTLTNDMLKIFESYYLVSKKGASIPQPWPESLATSYNMHTPFKTKIDGIPSSVFYSVSPPEFQTEGRTGDIDAIIDIMQKSQKFIYVAVMDFIPGFIYNPTFTYWPRITNELLHRSIDHGVEVKLLISKWPSTREMEITFLQSLDVLRNISHIQIKLFQFPKPIVTYVPYTLVNHNKYMVTDNCGYVGTNNWTGDYFTNTGGIGTIINQTEAINSQPDIKDRTIQEQLRKAFMRDWNSEYAHHLPKL